MNTNPPLLIIREQSSTLLFGRTGSPLSTGWQNVLPGPIRRCPPNAYDLEMAIQYIEDTIMPVLSQYQAAGDELNVELPTPVGPLPVLAEAEGRYAIDAIEQAFRRLCEIAEGSPVGNDVALIAPEVVSVLLILREVMHHGGFSVLQMQA